MEGKLLEGNERDFYAMLISNQKPFEKNESFYMSEYCYRIPEEEGVVITEMCGVDDCDLYLYTDEEWLEYRKPWGQRFDEMRSVIRIKAKNGDEKAIELVKSWEPKLTGIQQIAAERKRQVEEEGWMPDHDDQHRDGELSDAAVSYIMHERDPAYPEWMCHTYWPWDKDWFKPTTTIRNLVKAGALIAAEIDRLQRQDEKSTKSNNVSNS